MKSKVQQINEVLKTLDEQINFLKTHTNDQKGVIDQMNWADLGSLQKISNDLKETIQFIKGE